MGRKLAIAAVLALVAVGCGSVEQEPNLAKAVERTEATGSSRIEASGVSEEGGREFAFSCEGAADYERRRLRFICTQGFGDMIAIGDDVYLSSEAFGLRGAKAWVRIPPDDDGDSVHDISPQKILGVLRDASVETERIADEDVRGVPTVRYRLTVNCEEADIGCPGATAPVDVWIDDDGVVRRIQLEDDGSSGTIEFFDFGIEVDIEPPPPDQISDVDELFSGPSSCNREASPISTEQAVAALRRHGFSVRSDAQGCFGSVAAVLTNQGDSSARTREGVLSCFLYNASAADRPKSVVRRGVDGGDAELVLANLTCTILADSPNAEAKIDPLEEAFAELQRALQP